MFLFAQTIDPLRYWLELSYFFCGGILLVVIGAIGLYQLVLAKRSLKTASRRDAFRLTAERCDHYLNVIIPLLDKLDKKIAEKEITFFSNAKLSISETEIRIEGIEHNQEAEKRLEIANHMLNALNALEGFTIYFTSGLADESVAYDTVGRTFLYSTQKLAPEFIPFSADGYYQNLTSV